MKGSTKKRITAVALSMAFLLSAVLEQTGSNQKAKAADYGLGNPVMDSVGVTTWDCIYFGNYYQSSETVKEPIKWRVLSVEGDDAFLLADQNLDFQQYNTIRTDVTWESCTLRSWLNGYDSNNNVVKIDYSKNNFLDDAFNEAEQAAIRTTKVVNTDNPKYGTKGGNNTCDKCYLLSIDEASNADYGFYENFDAESVTRVAINTVHVSNIANAMGDTDFVDGNIGGWWLRSPGADQDFAAGVYEFGYSSGWNVNFSEDCGIRPVLHLDLSASVWTKAGQVKSGEDASPTKPSKATDAPDNKDTELHNPVVEMNTCDSVYFGNYWQEDTNGDGVADEKDTKTPIRWRILSRNKDDAYVIADKVLDRKLFHEIDENATWETSTLRGWLNGEFLNMAFTLQEQTAILEEVLENTDDNIYSNTGEGIVDKIYLPSIADMSDNELFESRLLCDQARLAKVTDFARRSGNGSPKSDKCIWWWLRSQGTFNHSAMYVEDDGSINTAGRNISKEPVDDSLDYGTGGVRPVLHLNLASPFVQSAQPIETSLKCAKWELVELGNYNEKPIKWRVLEASENDILLLSDEILEEKEFYRAKDEKILWKDSVLREWLNGDFYENAFSKEEKMGIQLYSYENPDNFWYDTKSGDSTQEFVTLLTMEDSINLRYGFPSECCCEHKARGVENGRGWWLRTPGRGLPGGISRYQACVGSSGCVEPSTTFIGSRGIRPVLHFNCSEFFLKKVGTVTAQEKNIEYSENTSNQPEKTSTPIEKPDTTGNPKPTGEPDVTTSSKPTGEPDVTASPKPTGKPDVTASPKPTGKPDITASPKPMGTPDVTASSKPTDEPNATNSPLKGMVLRDSKNKVSYKVIAPDKTVAFYKANNKKTTKIVIPAIVTINGIEYKVTAISDNAFNGCKNLNSVSIGKYVTSIGNKAFFKCASLKKIIIPASMTKIGKRAFYGCKKLKSITIKSKKLRIKSVGSQAFKGIHKKAVIKVPKKQKKAYKKWLRKKGIAKRMKIK